MSYDYYRSAFPKGYAMLGWNPQNPVKQTIALPVVTTTNTETGITAPEFVWPGHILSVTADGKALRKGVPSGTPAPAIIAFAQDPSRAPSVVDVGTLVGLSCSDRFRFATPFFARTKTSAGLSEIPNYVAGTRLTYCVDGETEVDETGAAGRSLTGYIRPAKDGEPVIGIVAETHNSSVNGALALQDTFETATNSSCIPENAYFVIFDSTFSPDVTARLS